MGKIVMGKRSRILSWCPKILDEYYCSTSHIYQREIAQGKHVSVILREEMRRKSTSETSRNALTVENRGRQKDRGKGSGNHGNSRKGRS
jgi:hypothetical protein